MKKQRDFTLGEPWSSAQRALEAYNREMREAPVHACAPICNKHGPLMAGISARLPKNVTPRIFEGGSTNSEPHTAPELAQVPLNTLHQSLLTEIELAPTELRETMAQFAALVGAELAVCQLAELLDEASDPNASFVEELAVADSMERINVHYHHLVDVMRCFTAELTKTYPELESLIEHAQFLKHVAEVATSSSMFIKSKLSEEDPLLSAAARLRHSGADLEKIASKCEEDATNHLNYWQDLLGGAKAQNPPNRLGLNRKSMVGLLSTLALQDGKLNMLIPSEAKRRKRIDLKLSRRRLRGGGDSSDDEANARKGLEKAESAYNQCTKCGNVFREDAAFCRKCGTKRPESPSSAQRDAIARGPPALKNVNREEDLDDEETDRAFLDRLRRKDPEKKQHDVWGAPAFHPTNRDIPTRLKQKDTVGDVSDDEKATRGLVAGDDLTQMGTTGQRR